MNRIPAVAIALALAGPAAAAPPRIPVEVHVEVAEVDNARAARLGVEWLDRIAAAERRPAGLLQVGPVERLTPLAADLHFLQSEGAAELLANPNLITDSGTAATFHAGGEIPYIVTSSLGTAHVEFKPYGVVLKIRPVVTEAGWIRMEIDASVSSPDASAGVLVNGNAVPALLERRVATNVTLRPGSTMTLAGLVQSLKEETVRGVPLLKRIPLLGALFRWSTRSERRTTVVVFVTPKILEI